VKFDLGRASTASGADTCAARRAVSGFAVCREAVVAGARPAELCPPAPVEPAMPAACGKLAPRRLLLDSTCPSAAAVTGQERLFGSWAAVDPADALGLPFWWRRLEESGAAGQDTFKQFPFLTTE